MFKLVVLSALLAVVAAKPGYLHAPVAYAAPVAVPAAVSHQYRTDVISKPVVAAYHAAPVAYAAPAVAYAAPAVAYPAAVSHQSRVDVYSKPVIASYAAPAVVAYGGHYGYAAHGW